MITKVGVTGEVAGTPVQCSQEFLVEQNLWLIRLRWIAVAGVVAAVLANSYVLPYPVLTSALQIYICVCVLLLSNIVYLCIATKKGEGASPKDAVLAMVQVEADLVILTAVLHFAGGTVNPFFLFYIFHVIIATVILPRTLSFIVGLTTIFLFGLLACNELNGGAWLGYFPLQLPAVGALWRNPVYLFGTFVAFVCTVVLAQYLTRIVIARMTAKELEAARNNELLEAVINAMSEGLMFVTADKNVAICNPEAKLWKKNDRIGRTEDSLEDFPTALSEHIEALFVGTDGAGGAGQTIEFDTAGPEQRHIEAKSSSVVTVDSQKLGYVIVGQDMTEHKRLESDLLERTEEVTAINEMLKMSRVEMAQREKMVAIGQMATGIAHEIGNPLASLSSVVQYLGRKLSADEEKEHLLLINQQINRISNILKRMLSMSRPATAEYRWVDINEVIDSTLSLVKFDRRIRSVAIENVSGTDLPMVWLNPQLFEQVLLNLFINALDAMDAKQTETGHILKVTRECRDGMIEVRVSDTGVGMSPEVCKRAFESFFTTKEIGKGTGLGLFISYNLITEVDGSICLESKLGLGTTVVVRIPIRPKKDLIGGCNGQGDSVSGAKAGKENDA
jgi:signal transduction histidine kinase